MLHQVIVKKEKGRFTVAYEIFNSKPDSRSEKLTMLAAFHNLKSRSKSKDCEFTDNADVYQITGSFKMASMEFDYTNAIDPASILRRLRNRSTSKIINSILELAGEKTCHRENKP
jgi:hypothetical protein